VTGHTDRLGIRCLHQKLSERARNAVRDYLVSKGGGQGEDETIAWARSSRSCSATRRT